jgi:UDP-N-acetylmuramate--alanine ligase
MKLSDFQKIHFIGVGGIGMSALARLCLHEKKEVSGSDRAPSAITKALADEGVTVYESQGENNIHSSYDLVVYTEAVGEGSEGYPELLKARELSIPTVNYFDALGMVANEYYLIAVAGSHGKTTTTAMLIDILETAGLDPSAVVGSLRAKTKSNYRAGKSKYFIVEACEYRRDFLSLTPDVLVITNLEHEHVDYYKDLEAVQLAFREFVGQVRPGGFVVANLADEKVKSVLTETKATVVDYGKYFNPLRQLTMPGMHNQQNAAAAVAAASQVGISEVEADQALGTFAGTWRRFEYKGEVNGAKVYDDYGHHPTEIVATIKGVRELYPNKKLILIFQSHTYTRTHELFDDFVAALKLADQTYVLPIYAAREENISGVSHTKLAEAIGDRAQAFDNFGAVIQHVRATAGPDDTILVMGAGDITRVANELVV